MVRFTDLHPSPREIPTFGIVTAMLVILGGTVGHAHNLDQVNTYLAFDNTTVSRLEARFAENEPLIQAEDEIGLIFKSTPGPGTTYGAGGYFTFYIPPGTQVIGVDYGRPNGTGGYTVLPIKPPAEMSLGAGSVSSSSTTALTGLTLGPNINGQTATTVTSSGVHRGTLAGVYGDTGVFYSTDPATVWGSFTETGGFDGNLATNDNVLVNNNGNSLTPTNRWDAGQLVAFGLKSPTAPLVDPNGRGNGPWGMGSPVAGPQSGYAWGFDWDYWRSHPTDPARMKNSIRVGPWNRIQYPGSSAAFDQPGLNSTTRGIAVADASGFGIPVSATNPLPPTLSWSDLTSPKAIRIAFGGLQLGFSEYARVRLKVLANAGEPDSPFQTDGGIHFFSDVSGGDAGGTSDGKDHTWRYVKASPLQLETSSLFQKRFVKPTIAVGETSYFDLTVANTGAGSLENVIVQDAMPSGLSYVSASETPITTNPLRWSLGTLPGQSVRRIRVHFTGTSLGLRFNTAGLSWNGGTKSAQDSIDVTKTGSPALPPDLAVGNLVFVDWNGNGRADAGEGVPGVTVELYPADHLPGVDPPRATQVTGSLGNYLFTGLEQDDYIVHIPPSQFQNNGPLFGWLSLPGVGTLDDDVDEDGIDSMEPWVTGITSREFTLAPESAPTAASGETGFQSSSDDDDDANTDLTIDFGFYPPLGVGNLVFLDTNDNGHYDPGEGVAGVSVELYRALQFPGIDPPLATTTTTANGSYFFDYLQTGLYKVHMPASAFQSGAPLEGTTVISDIIAGDDDVGQDGIDIGDPALVGVTTGVFSLALGSAPTGSSGETGFNSDSDDDRDAAVDLTIDFGFRYPVGLGNMVFIDANENGRFDHGEGVPNVRVELYRAADTPGSDLPLFSQTTDADGVYFFDKLNPGSYRVFIPPSQFALTAPLWGHLSLPDTQIGGDDDIGENGIDDFLPEQNGIRSDIVVLQRGTQPTDATFETGAFNHIDNRSDADFNLTIDFGFSPVDPMEVGVGNLVFVDENGNGRYDSGEGRDGVLIELFTAGANPLADSPLAQMVTSEGGLYLFRRLVEGSYFVHVPASQFQTGAPLAGLASLPGSGGDWGIDDDLDENGIDAPEPWLSGISSTTFYLSPGTEPTNDWGEFGQSFEIDDANDANFDLTIDLGFAIPMGIGNLVFYDANGNGRADPGEGVAGVTVQIFPYGGSPTFDPPLTEVVTDSLGRFLFDNLSPGVYFLHIPFWHFSDGGLLEDLQVLGGEPEGDDDVGQNGIAIGSMSSFGVSSHLVSLTPGQAPVGSAESGFDGASDDANDSNVDLTIDFGFAPPASLGNLVFHDINGDGLRQPDGADGLPGTADDEVGLPNVQLELWSPGPDGAIGGGDDTLILAGITSDFSGHYLASHLPGGQYYLVIPASNFELGGALHALPVASPGGSVTDDGMDDRSHGNQPDGRSTAVYSPLLNLNFGQDKTTIDFGFLANYQPITWAEWQFRNIALSDLTPLGNPDGDEFSNLAEFAFGLNAGSGQVARQPLRLVVDPLTHRIDAAVERVTGLADTQVTLQVLFDLVNSPQGWVDVTTIEPSLTFRNNGTEQALYQDIGNLPQVNHDSGYVRLKVSLDADQNGSPEAIEHSQVHGWARRTFGTHLQTFGHSFASPASFSGRVDGATSNFVDLSTSLAGSPIEDILESGISYYLEVLSGPHSGHRLEVHSASSTGSLIAIDIGNERNTLTDLPTSLSTLVNSQVALRRHLTLGSLADRNLFNGTNNPATADRLLFHHAPNNSFRTYWLAAFGQTRSWLLQGTSDLVDQSHLVIEPGRGIFIHPRYQPVTMVIHGQVRPHPFAIPLRHNLNFTSPGWPAALSAAQLSLNHLNGFVGAATSASADQIQIWRGDTLPGTNSFDGYFYLRVGTTFDYWTRVGDSNLPNLNAEPLFQPHRATFIRSLNRLPFVLQPLPWQP